jgi:phosphohistidine phosphatase
MEIHLMQHGSCLPKEADPQMPLSPVGLDQIERSAEAVRLLGLGFDRIVASPKLRSQQTAEAVARAVGYAPADIVVADAVKAMAPPAETVEFLCGLGVGSVLVAGHLPNLAELASWLMGGAKVAVDNGGLICLEADDPRARDARLAWSLTPMQMQLVAGA